MKFKILKRRSEPSDPLPIDTIQIYSPSDSFPERTGAFCLLDQGGNDNIRTPQDIDFAVELDLIKHNDALRAVGLSALYRQEQTFFALGSTSQWYAKLTNGTLYGDCVGDMVVQHSGCTVDPKESWKFYSHRMYNYTATERENILELFAVSGRARDSAGLEYMIWLSPDEADPALETNSGFKYGLGFWIPSFTMPANPSGTSSVIAGKTVYPAITIKVHRATARWWSYALWLNTIAGNIAINAISTNYSSTDAYSTVNPVVIDMTDSWTHVAGVIDNSEAALAEITIFAEADAKFEICLPTAMPGRQLIAPWQHIAPLPPTQYL